MGQYYRAYLEKEKDNYEVLKAATGSKLMEIALIERDFTSYVMTRLLDSPHLTAFIGDYAGYQDDAFGPFSHDEYMLRYRRTWKEKKEIDSIPRLSKEIEKAFILNNTKKSFLSMERYSENAWLDGWGRYIHPLVILTACGNGRGGGDYHVSCCSLKKLVGAWAFDEIMVCSSPDTIPSDFRDVTDSVMFFENGRC